MSAVKTVIITGCSSGIGLATAIKLASDKARYKVYATMRNLSKSSELEEKGGDLLNKTLFVRELDVTIDSTINSVVEEIIRVDHHIDVLVNNAGIGHFGMFETLNMDTIRRIFDTNIFGTIRVTQAVLPYMKKQQSGSIVNLSSQAGYIGYPFNDIYSASKFAIEGFTESLAPMLRLHNIHVCLIEPGFVNTNFVANIMAHNNSNKGEANAVTVDSASHEQYDTFFSNVFKHTSQISESAEHVADVIAESLVNDEKHLRYQTSDYTKMSAGEKFKDPSGDTSVDNIMAYFK